MNLTRHRQRQLGRSRRFTLGLLGSAGMAVVLIAALYLSAPHARTDTPEAGLPTRTAGSQGVLSSGTGAGTGAGLGPGSATFHEDADLRQLAPEPDPSPAAIAAY